MFKKNVILAQHFGSKTYTHALYSELNSTAQHRMRGRDSSLSGVRHPRFTWIHAINWGEIKTIPGTKKNPVYFINWNVPQLEYKQRIKSSFDLRHLSEVMREISEKQNVKGKNQARLCSSFQLWNPICSGNKADSVPPVWTGKAEQNLGKRKEKSLRKCWLVYADSPVNVLPKLLLWELLRTLPAPSGSYQCSHVFLLQSPSAVRSARRTGGVFSPPQQLHTSSFLKKKKKCTVSIGLQPSGWCPTQALRRRDNYMS